MFQTGNERIDNDHARIIELVNALDDNGLPLDKRYNLFSYTAVYIENHLSIEEDFMYTIGYPGIKEHLQEHRKLKVEFIELLKELVKDEPSTKSMKDFKMLFLHHIEHWDCNVAKWQSSNN